MTDEAFLLTRSVNDLASRYLVRRSSLSLKVQPTYTLVSALLSFESPHPDWQQSTNGHALLQFGS